MMLNQSAPELEVTTLTKQLRLMSNLFSHDFDEVPEQEWESLLIVLQHSKEMLASTIENENGPKKKKKAQIALDALFLRLEKYFSQDVAAAA